MPNEVSSTVPLAYPPACALCAHAPSYSRFVFSLEEVRRPTTRRTSYSNNGRVRHVRSSSQAPRGLRLTRPSQERSGSASTPTVRAQPPTAHMRQRRLSIFRARSRRCAFDPAPPRNSVGTVVPAAHELRVRPHPSYAFLFSHSPRPRNIIAPPQRPRASPATPELTMWYRNICVASHIPFLHVRVPTRTLRQSDEARPERDQNCDPHR